MRAFSFAGGKLPPGEKTYLMGILNVTPDSFSDGMKYLDPASALAHAKKLQADGADILDVGACSTRPFGERASEEEELRRLKSVLPALKNELDIPISVDTYRPEVARYALETGAGIINDVSGGFSSEMAALIKGYGAGLIVMHAGDEKTEAVRRYPDGVLADVQRVLDGLCDRYLSAGVKPEQLCLDPGFGFAKTAEQNTELLQTLSQLDARGHALLIGLSRKRFISSLSEEADQERLFGTLAADLFAQQSGADILRVHDVKAHLPAVRAMDRLIGRKS
ncbi:MAG: dihydropteroate synthase [Clostridia bacterium]|nr:dihydropteroate synthase [Clostridia bacterium]